MSRIQRLQDLDSRVDAALRRRGLRLLLHPGDYQIIGSTRRLGRLGRPRLLVRVWRDQAVLISWPVSALAVLLIFLCTVEYVHLWEGPGHSAVVPAVLVVVFAVLSGVVMRAAARTMRAPDEELPPAECDADESTR